MTRWHHGRGDVPAEAGAGRAAEQETDAPDAMVDRLLGLVFEIFYKGGDGRRWLQDQKPLLMVLTWPAVWLNQRGVGMPAAEYETKMRDIIGIIARHGDLAKIKLVPAYLGDCVRKHFAHHGDEIYAARKHVRAALDVAALQGRAAAAAPDAVPALVAAHAVLATGRKAARPRKTDDLQGSLF